MTFAAFGTAPISMVEFGVARDIAPFVRSMGFDWLLLVALGVLLFWPREFDVESGTSSDGSSHPWHDFFELESVTDNGWSGLCGGWGGSLTHCKIACHRHLWNHLCSSLRHRSSTMSAFCVSFVYFGTRLWPSVINFQLVWLQIVESALPVAPSDPNLPLSRSFAVDTNIC